MTKNLKAECLRRAAASFKNFLCENRRALTAAFCFTLVCYGFMLTHYTLTIDEETWICNTDPALIQKIWMLQGRFGLYLFDAVFTPLGRYVPFLWDFLGIVFWFAGGVVFCFCLTRYVSAVSRLSVGVFAAMFTTVPRLWESCSPIPCSAYSRGWPCCWCRLRPR